MFSRGLACCLFLSMASMALAGARVTMGISQGQTLTPGTGGLGYAPGQSVLVDVLLQQDPAGTARELRHAQFDFKASSPELVMLGPVTHNIDFDVRFFDFHGAGAGSPEPMCLVSTDNTCGDGYFFDSSFSQPAGDRAKVVSMTYYYTDPQNLGSNPSFTRTLPASGQIRIGQLQVNLPSNSTPMCYNIDALNAAETDPDKGGADIRFGFGTDVDGVALTTWRANLPAPNNITSGNTGPGGVFQIGVNMSCGGCGLDTAITRWDSVQTHRRTGVELGPIGLEITSNNLFVEPRQGMRKIVVSFSNPFDPATAIPANVQIVGRDVNQALLNLSANVISVVPTNGNTKMEINFTPALPNLAKYRVTLNNIKAPGSCPVIAANNQRMFYALLGDVTNNRNVQTNDVAGARSLIPVAGTQIDPAIATHVRSDATLDARVTTQDVGGIRSQVGMNATGIMDP